MQSRNLFLRLYGPSLQIDSSWWGLGAVKALLSISLYLALQDNGHIRDTVQKKIPKEENNLKFWKSTQFL